MTQHAQMSQDINAEKVVRTYFGAYPARDRAAIESVMAEDFHFTSPLDNRIDRRTYFERCWPNSDDMAVLDLQHIVVNGERVFVAYEIRIRDSTGWPLFEQKAGLPVRLKQTRVTDIRFRVDRIATRNR